MVMLIEWMGRPLPAQEEATKSRAKNLQHFKSIHLAKG